MTILRPLSVAVTLFSLLAASHGAAGLTASLTLEPTHVLPGIAPTLHVVVTNDAGEDTVLPQKLLLRVVPTQGSAFMAQWGAGQEQRFSNARFPGEVPAKVAGHSRDEFFFTSYTLDGVPGWFYDSRLNQPGTYRLQLLMLDSFSETSVFRANALSIENAVAVSLASNEAVLTIDTPGGEDAELWQRLKSIASQRGASGWSPIFWGYPGWREFVRDAVDDKPGSPYAPLVMRDYAETPTGELVTSDERLAKAERILKAQPMTPAREDLQLFIAQMKVRIAQHVSNAPRPDLNRAADYYERARTDYLALERTARDPEIRRRSREERERLPDIADLREPR